MNNRGQAQLLLPFIIPIVIGIILLIAFVAFLASPLIRNILIGIAGVIAAIYVVTKTNSNKIKAITVVVLLAVSFIFIFGAGVLQTTLSVSENIKVDGSGGYVIITTTPGTDSKLVSLTVEELNEQLKTQGYEASKGVEIKAQLTDYKQTYTLVKDTNTPFYTIKEVDTGNYVLTYFSGQESSVRSKLITECTNRGKVGVVTAYMKPDTAAFSVDNLICIEKTIEGFYGYAPGAAFNKWTVNVNALNLNKQLTRDVKSISFGDNDIVVSYEGSLEATDVLKNVNLGVFWNNGAFGPLIPTTAPNTQTTAFANYDKCLQGITAISNNYNKNVACGTTLVNTIRAGRGNSNNILTSQSIVVPNSINFATKPGDVNTGELTYSIQPGSEQIPVLVITVKGKFLGLHKLQGIPKLENTGICSQTIIADAGDNNKLSNNFVEISNIGTDTGTFDVSVVCDNNQISGYLPSLIFVDAGKTTKYNIQLTGSSTTQGATVNSKCTITVKDRNSAKSATCNYNLELKFAKAICVPTQTSCSDDRSKVLTCNSQGTSQTNVACKSDEQCGLSDSGDVKCIKKTLADVIGNVINKDTVVNTGTPALTETEKQIASCEAKAKSNPFLGWTPIVTTTNPTTGEKILTVLTFGAAGSLNSDTKVDCSPKFVPYYVYGTIIVLTLISIMYILMSGKRKRYSRGRR